MYGHVLCSAAAHGCNGGVLHIIAPSRPGSRLPSVRVVCVDRGGGGTRLNLWSGVHHRLSSVMCMPHSVTVCSLYVCSDERSADVKCVQMLRSARASQAICFASSCSSAPQAAHVCVCVCVQHAQATPAGASPYLPTALLLHAAAYIYMVWQMMAGMR